MPTKLTDNLSLVHDVYGIRLDYIFLKCSLGLLTEVHTIDYKGHIVVNNRQYYMCILSPKISIEELTICMVDENTKTYVTKT